MPAFPRPIDYDRVRQLASQGLTQTQVADSLGISRSSVQQKLGTGKGGSAAADTEFQQAFQAGKAALAVEVTNEFLKHMRSGSLDAAKFLAERMLGFSKAATNINIESAPEKSGPGLTIILQTEAPTEE